MERMERESKNRLASVSLSLSLLLSSFPCPRRCCCIGAVGAGVRAHPRGACGGGRREKRDEVEERERERPTLLHVEKRKYLQSIAVASIFALYTRVCGTHTQAHTHTHTLVTGEADKSPCAVSLLSLSLSLLSHFSLVAQQVNARVTADSTQRRLRFSTGAAARVGVHRLRIRARTAAGLLSSLSEGALLPSRQAADATRLHARPPLRLKSSLSAYGCSLHGGAAARRRGCRR